jgi:choline kinase
VTRAAIILAAGMGTRLGHDEPKALVKIDGIALLDRALDLLLARGVCDVRVVTGHKREAFAAFARKGVSFQENREYATTGTWRSLRCGLDRVPESFLLLEGDLFYEARALDALLADPRPDVLLASDFTGASDEVWVEAREGQLRALSKDRHRLSRVDAELVGITKLSKASGEALRAFDLDARASYETDALVQLAQQTPIAVRIEAGLLWGEIDDAHHLDRITRVIAPRVNRTR